MKFHVAAAVVLMLAAGCGPGGPPLHPVSGQVVFKDCRPVPGGVIEFAPAAGGPAARARIGPDGRFTLATDGRPGAVAGVHRVAVLATAGADAAGPAGHNKGQHHKGQSVHPKHARLDGSGIEVTVAEKENEVRVEVSPAD